MLQAPAS